MSPDLTIDGYRRCSSGSPPLHQTLDRRDRRAARRPPPGEALVELDVDRGGGCRCWPTTSTAWACRSPRRWCSRCTSLAGALGALYVSEGATLGGSVIAPHVRSVLGPDTPVDFFAPPGVDVVAALGDVPARDRPPVGHGRPIGTRRSRVAVAVFERFAEVLGP